jgi:aminopeptidase
VSGHVVSTKPLSYQGSLIDGIAVRFEEGCIVAAKAARRRGPQQGAGYR